MIRIFRVFIPVGVLALLISEILLITSSYVLASHIVLEVDPEVFLLYDGGLTRIGFVLASILIGLHFQDLYTRIYIRSSAVLMQQLCLIMGTAFLVQALVSYVRPNLRLPIRVMLIGSMFALVAIFAWRLFYSRYAARVVGQQRLLLVGGSPLLLEIADHVSHHPELGLEVAGYVDDQHSETDDLPGGKHLGRVDALRD